MGCAHGVDVRSADDALERRVQQLEFALRKAEHLDTENKDLKLKLEKLSQYFVAATFQERGATRLDPLAFQVLSYWFGVGHDGHTLWPEQYLLWFGSVPASDEDVALYEAEMERAAAGHYDHWATEPLGALALVVLLGQLPRMLFPGSPRAHAHDDKAKQLVQTILEKRMDEQLIGVERMFMYLPLMHLEDVEVHRQAARLVQGVAGGMPEKHFALWTSLFDRHLRVIERFGRFPHRNAMLGRQSTDAEIDFLSGPDILMPLALSLLVNPASGVLEVVGVADRADHKEGQEVVQCPPSQMAVTVARGAAMGTTPAASPIGDAAAAPSVQWPLPPAHSPTSLQTPPSSPPKRLDHGTGLINTLKSGKKDTHKSHTHRASVHFSNQPCTVVRRVSQTLRRQFSGSPPSPASLATLAAVKKLGIAKSSGRRPRD